VRGALVDVELAVPAGPAGPAVAPVVALGQLDAGGVVAAGVARLAEARTRGGLAALADETRGALAAHVPVLVFGAGAAVAAGVAQAGRTCWRGRAGREISADLERGRPGIAAPRDREPRGPIRPGRSPGSLALLFN
jgi:hypothetical protein